MTAGFSAVLDRAEKEVCKSLAHPQVGLNLLRFARFSAS